MTSKCLIDAVKTIYELKPGKQRERYLCVREISHTENQNHLFYSIISHRPRHAIVTLAGNCVQWDECVIENETTL